MRRAKEEERKKADEEAAAREWILRNAAKYDMLRREQRRATGGGGGGGEGMEGGRETWREKELPPCLEGWGEFERNGMETASRNSPRVCHAFEGRDAAVMRDVIMTRGA